MAKKYRITPIEDELVKLLHSPAAFKEGLNLSFGPSGAWFEWEEGTPLPMALIELGRLRGLYIENCDGDGI
jgi:hypothetical protein